MKHFKTGGGGTVSIDGAATLETPGVVEITEEEKNTASTALNLPRLVKAECGARIFAVASSNAQMNMAASAAAGLLSPAQSAAFAAGLVWIAAMRAKCTDLIAANDTTYYQDAHWPAVPSTVAALAAEF